MQITKLYHTSQKMGLQVQSVMKWLNKFSGGQHDVKFMSNVYGYLENKTRWLIIYQNLKIVMDGN